MTPASEFVAGFIGSPAMNIFSVAVEGGEAVLPGGHRLPLAGLPARPEVRLGLRPEDMEIVAEDRPGIPVVLKSVEWLGADAFGYGTIEGSDVPMTLRLPGATAAARGQRMRVAPMEGRVHLFAPDTGKRL